MSASHSVRALLLVFGVALPWGCSGQSGAPRETGTPGPTPAAKSSAEAEAEAKTRVAEQFGKLPLTFIANKGQQDRRVRFYVAGRFGTVFFTPKAVVYSIRERSAPPDSERHPGAPRTPGETGDETTKEPSAAKDPAEVAAPEKEPPATVRGVVIRQNFLDADPQVNITGEKELEGKVNIYRGNDPSKHHTEIPTFQQIVYKELWPGIDLLYRGDGGRLTYQYVVRAGGDPSKIRVGYEGLEKLSIGDDGKLTLHTALGNIGEAQPTAYQQIDGQRQAVRSALKLLGELRVGFELGDYDAKHPLIIGSVSR